MRTRYLIFLFILSGIHELIIAQPNRPTGGKMPAIGHVFGKVINAQTKESVPFVSIAAYKRDSLIGGCLAGTNGEFSLENLPFGPLKLKITFVGFKPLQQPVTITPQTVEQDLGDLKLEVEETLLKSVEVVADKSASQMSIDRKVFNVDKDLTVKGGTATDVMKNIPSVTVDNDGNAQLRQNAAIIYVDGRPTTLTLDQIPADQIERVEVITNPSVKFEASTTGGIINIVMKSNSKPGYNGMISAGAGTNDHYVGNVALNFKQKPIGFSVNYNYNSFLNPVTGYSNRTSLADGQPVGTYDTRTNTSFKHQFQAASATFDYYINNRNRLSISENMAFGNFNNYDVQAFESKSNDSVVSYGTRETNAKVHFENYTTTAHYLKTFPKQGKQFTIDATFNTTHAKNPSDYTTYTYTPTGSSPDNPQLQQNDGHNQGNLYIVAADYVNPITDSTKLEYGIRSTYRPSDQVLDVSEYSYTEAQYLTDNYLTNHYQIKDLVNAAYINYSMRFKKIDYAFGLRFEDSYYKGILVNRNDSSFLYHYPANLNTLMNALFPSIFISKKLSEKQEIQFNVSRKINRPNFRQLMPFIMANDPKNYTIGNPNLTPEFITLSELNFNQYVKNGNFFLSLFYRNTQNPLTMYSSPSPTDPTILINTTINGDQSNTIGMDNTFKYTLFKGFEATLNMNLFYSVIQATYANVKTSNEGFNYTGKLNLTYKLPKSFSLQLSGSYESPRVLPQGETREFYFADMGISKDITKFISLTASVSDIFDTKGRGLYYTTDQYIQDSWNRRESRFIRVVARFRFGKADAPIFKKRSQSDDGDGGFF